MSFVWLTSKRHSAACCVSSIRPSLIRTAPAHGVGSGLESMRNVTLPAPCPCGDDVIAAQPTADVADHVHLGIRLPTPRSHHPPVRTFESMLPSSAGIEMKALTAT